MNSIHISSAAKIIDSGDPFDAKVWRTGKDGRGEIITYRNVIRTSYHQRSGNVRVKLLTSGEIRQFNIIALFELNQMEVFL